jgi:hypothetical protein
MNTLSMDKKCAVVAALVEGCSIRSTERLTGVARHTILNLLVEGRFGLRGLSTARHS